MDIRKLQSLCFTAFRAECRRIHSSPVALDASEGWLSKLLVRKIEPTKESHSRLLADKEVIYEIKTDNVRPDRTEEYLKNYEKHTEIVNSKPELQLDHVASWGVSVGDQDQFLHLYKYTGGYASIDKARDAFENNPDSKSLAKERAACLRSRHAQFVLPFSYWPQVEGRKGNRVYEIRSYVLKPGTMIEWGNNWARAISFRKENSEAFGGFFSQVGRLYQVHHIWTYADLQSRKETREAAWRKPGWDECVAYTVPLIKEMDSRILYPLSFSPSQ